MSKLTSALIATSVTVAVALTACGEADTAPEGTGESIVASGTVVNRSGAAVPSGARVLVAWVVSSGSPDYTYVLGEGTLDADAGTFRVELDGPPPAEALNADVLGVGLILATTDQDIGEGDDVATLPDEEIVGLAGRYAIIYIAGDAATDVRDWAADFDDGYNVGRGVEGTGSFDGFEPAVADEIELIVDDLSNIEIVNWT